MLVAGTNGMVERVTGTEGNLLAFDFVISLNFIKSTNKCGPRKIKYTERNAHVFLKLSSGTEVTGLLGMTGPMPLGLNHNIILAQDYTSYK